AQPVHLTDLGTYASPFRHLDYLLVDLQPAVLLYEHGIMVNVPAPGRFAVHKCVVSQKRPAAFAAKALKDRSQAEQVFQVLLENRPTDISLAYEAAKAHDEAFVSDFRSGLRRIDKDVAAAVQAQIENIQV
ncbi:MAG: GSU2403 family nucleotidyltransferase fold protein, partial [Gammaproteobacteria bacterium]|nr:GSU2403 family nucleotidyltransferase fold protein [Gammaproteobacteria bacterium]